MVARLAMADLRSSRDDQQQRDLPLRHQGREAAAGDVRVFERQAAGVRPGRQVPLLRVRPIVRAGLRQLRQFVDVSEPDAARRGAAPQGRQVAARGPQRRRGPSRPSRRPTRRRTRRRKKRRTTTADSRRRRPTSTSISTASRRAASCCRPRPATMPICRRSRASCSTAVCRGPARATRRAQSFSSTSRSATRRRCSTKPTASRRPPTARSCS